MIREFSQKNNIFYLAFLVAELDDIGKDTLIYTAKTRPKEFLNKLIHTPLFELHEYLKKVEKEMKKETNNALNIILYS
jgi:hypothetical protein